MKEQDIAFGETIFDWEKPIGRFYYIRDGEVILRVKKEKNSFQNELSKKNVLRKAGRIDDQLPALLNDKLWTENNYVDISLLGKGECFAEEFLFVKGNPKYRAVVASARCQLVSIPFMSLRLTLSTYSMYTDSAREKIVQRYVTNQNLRADIHARGQLSLGERSADVVENAMNNWLSTAANVSTVAGIRADKVEGLPKVEQQSKKVIFPMLPLRDTSQERDPKASFHVVGHYGGHKQRPEVNGAFSEKWKNLRKASNLKAQVRPGPAGNTLTQ